MIERRHIHLDGLRLSYLEQGAAAEDEQSLVLVHGLLGCAETFLPLMHELGPDRHLIALDLPGSGLSERREDIDATLASNGHLLALLIEALGLQNPVVLGHSHGGAVAVRMAAQNRELLHSLVLLAPAHPWFDEGDPVVRFYLSLPGRLLAYAMPWFPQWLQMMGLRRMAGPQSWDTPERLRPYRESLRIKGTISHLLKLLRTWHQDMAGLRRALRKPLATPTLILWGDADRAVPVGSAEELRKHLLRSELHILPGVGHRPAEERPAIVAGLIADWLKVGASFIQAESLRYKPSSSAAQPRIAALMASSLEAGD